MRAQRTATHRHGWLWPIAGILFGLAFLLVWGRPARGAEPAAAIRLGMPFIEVAQALRFVEMRGVPLRVDDLNYERGAMIPNTDVDARFGRSTIHVVYSEPPTLKSIAYSFCCTARRLRFTPRIVPSDVNLARMRQLIGTTAWAELEAARPLYRTKAAHGSSELRLGRSLGFIVDERFASATSGGGYSYRIRIMKAAAARHLWSEHRTRSTIAGKKHPHPVRHRSSTSN